MLSFFILEIVQINFISQGHIETIFDCKFKSADPKILATASFDGMVKIWSAVDLTHIATSSGNEGVIYSLSWAPGKSLWNTVLRKAARCKNLGKYVL